MFWSLELDRRPGEDQQIPALIPLMSSQMQGGLLYSENELQYPFSSELQELSFSLGECYSDCYCVEYDNLRSGRI